MGEASLVWREEGVVVGAGLFARLIEKGALYIGGVVVPVIEVVKIGADLLVLAQGPLDIHGAEQIGPPVYGGDGSVKEEG
jgi:hypothetical protein